VGAEGDVTAVDDLTLVVGLACEAEARSDKEQDALLRVAASVDAKANALVVTNQRHGPASRLYALVAETRGFGGRPRHNTKTLEKLEAQAQRWEHRFDRDTA
jgi:hypothetical protein